MSFIPKISVVMICYNQERYIGEAVESILSQTYQDFELIIIDDGSTDNTLKIIREYRDPRITSLTQRNSGPSIALNAGIDRSRGEFIAFMSGDDISPSERLTSQIRQIELHKADMVFSLPQIIGPSSEVLSWEVCPWFYGREFDTTPQLYRTLFSNGNFLCAPSAFCRRTAIEKVGHFRRGLIQLQDFDYWIRACKKELVIRMFKGPLIQYRYLHGENLSRRTNLNRTQVERLEIYRSFFEEVPIDFFREAFSDTVVTDARGDSPNLEIEKSFLLFNHSDPAVKAIGAGQIIRQLDNNETYERLLQDGTFDITSFFQSMNSISLDGGSGVSKIRTLFGFLRKIIEPRLVIGVTEAEVKQNIQRNLERGNYNQAVRWTRKLYNLHFYQTQWERLYKEILEIYHILAAVLAKIKPYIIEKITRNQYQQLTVFTLARMYDYCKQADLIVYEDQPEQVYIRKPHVVGNFDGELHEGNAALPTPYVSILEDAIITSGSSLVVSHQGILLNDELVDFPGEEYGFKSPSVRFRYKDKVVLDHRNGTHARIKDGITLSCDHDNNYFHWLVECLPKLLLIDELGQFKDVPLLVPKELHKNLIEALRKANIYNHPCILLENDCLYQVGRLIFPSALSRIVDRYQGSLVFDTDIVLSRKWISRVANLLKSNVNSNGKPWRKLFLTRRKGLRTVGNLEEVEQMLAENQFEIIEMDGLSLKYQIELFSQAAIVVAPTGAALTNMLYCQPGTKAIIFMSNHEISNYYFWPQLGDIVGLDVKIIAGQRLYNLTNYWSVHDDYIIDPQIVAEEINKYGK